MLYENSQCISHSDKGCGMDGGGDTQGENSLGESFFQVGGQVEGGLLQDW